MFKVKKHQKPVVQIESSIDSALRDRLYRDPVTYLGNSLAWDKFQGQPKQGVYVATALHDISNIDRLWGQKEGDSAVKAAFGALSQASKSNNGKMFRVGEHRGNAFFDSPESAYSFARQARHNLEHLVPVRGVHNHSVSIGLGYSPEQAEQALTSSQLAKEAAHYVPGHALTHAHSLLQGSEGPVDVEPARLSLPEGLKKPVVPGQLPMPLPDASQPWLGKSIPDDIVINCNPVPVYFLSNDKGLSPDGVAFLKSEELKTWYGDLTVARGYGFVPRCILAKTVQLMDNGTVAFEPLEKGLTGLALVGALAASSGAALPDRSSSEAHSINNQWSPIGLHADLLPVAHLESNFGEFVNHPRHHLGIHHTAYGALGFKPVTAYEEYQHAPAIQGQYPGLSNTQEFDTAFQRDPKFYNTLASSHFARLKAIGSFSMPA